MPRCENISECLLNGRQRNSLLLIKDVNSPRSGNPNLASMHRLSHNDSKCALRREMVRSLSFLAIAILFHGLVPPPVGNSYTRVTSKTILFTITNWHTSRKKTKCKLYKGELSLSLSLSLSFVLTCLLFLGVGPAWKQFVEVDVM